MPNLVPNSDLAVYLNNPAITADARATFILTRAETLCKTVVNPLPAGADIVILDVAERAYANPVSAGNQNPALYAEGEGPYNDVNPGHTGGGLWLTNNNRRTLRTLGGHGGGSFQIDLLPDLSDTPLPEWDQNPE